MGSYSVSINSIHWRDPLFRVKDSGFQLMTHVYSDWTKKKPRVLPTVQKSKFRGVWELWKIHQESHNEIRDLSSESSPR